MMAPPAIRPTNISTSCTRTKRRGTPRWRRTSVAMANVCSVLPVAITAAAASAPSTVRLAAKLPSKTPGQRRVPQRSSAASAMPEGGQIAVA
jgi:hypothetical protein